MIGETEGVTLSIRFEVSLGTRRNVCVNLILTSERKSIFNAKSKNILFLKRERMFFDLIKVRESIVYLFNSRTFSYSINIL